MWMGGGFHFQNLQSDQMCVRLIFHLETCCWGDLDVSTGLCTECGMWLEGI